MGDISKYEDYSKAYEASNFIKTGTEEELIDVSILALTVLSYSLPKKMEFVGEFVRIIDTITQPLLSRDSELLECRLSLFLGYYIDILYKEDQSTFLGVLKLLVESLMSNKKALANQSSDTLQTIISDKDLIPRIIPHISDLLGFTMACMEKVNIPDFFTFVHEIIDFYQEHLSFEQMIGLLTSMVNRLTTEVNDAISNGFKTTVAISKIWDLIEDFTSLRIMEKEPENKNQYLDAIEKTLLPAFGFITQATKIDFDDQILKTMGVFMESRGSVSGPMAEMFPMIGNSFEKHSMIFKELFNVIKSYCKQGRGMIENNPEALSTIFGFGTVALFHEDNAINGAVYLT